jgi:hypothetical protein
MSAVIKQTAPVAPVTPASQAAAQLVLQPGAIIDARVVAVRENLARILIAGLSLDVLTEVALQPGANLKLAVSQTADGVVRLAVVPERQGPPGVPAGAPNSTSATAISVTTTVSTSAQAQLPRVASASLAPATPEAIAISQAVQTAAPRQASLSPLFANLPVIVASPAVPQQVQDAASKLLAARPPLDSTLTANDLRQAFQKSGLFLEATLAKGASSAGPPDLKAALVVFKQVLSNWLGQGGAQPATAPSGAPQSVPAPQSAPVSQLLAQGVPQNPVQPMTSSATASAPPLAPGLVPEAMADEPFVASGQAMSRPGGGGGTEPQARMPLSAPAQAVVRELPELSGDVVRTAVQAVARDAAASLKPDGNAANTSTSDPKPAAQLQTPAPTPRLAAEVAPPFRGAVPSPQPIALPTLAPDTSPANMGRQLLEQTDAALARQTLLQVASLPDRPELGSTSSNNAQPRWSFEIPFATPQGTAMAQFEISRDGGNEVEAAAPTRVWRARFTLDVEPTGPVHALVSLVGEKTAVRMWAERPETAAQLRANADALSQALRQAELEPGDILVGEGAPPQPKTRAGRFLDRAT